MRKISLLAMLTIYQVSFSQETAEVPAVLKEFAYSSKEHPFGQRNERAPKELEQFGQLIGVWDMTSNKLWQGTWYKCCAALWVFKYSVDGYAIEDYWFRYKENHPPVGPNRDVDFHGLNLRFYDVVNQEWRTTWLDNLGAFNHYVAKANGDEIWMFPDNENPSHKIVFKNITSDSFEWNIEQRSENGQWRLTAKSYGTRRSTK